MSAAGAAPQPLLVTVREAASLLGIARSHLYLHLQAGSLPSVRMGRCRRIALSDLERFIACHREDGAQDSAHEAFTSGLPIPVGRR